jgi:hypothetical protein
MPCYYFKYTPATGSPLYLEDEPINWDKVLIILKRDRDWHGVNYEFTDGAIPLEFDCLSASEFIEEIYQAQGGDGYIGFEFGYYDGATEIPEYEGKIDLNSRKLLSTYRISANVEKAGLHDKIKTRWSTKADLFSGQSIGGSSITAPVPVNLKLHSKVLRNTYSKETSVEPTTPFAWTTCLGNEKHEVYFTFNTDPSSGGYSDIDATQGNNLGIVCDDPVTTGLLLFDLNAAGTFVFNIRLGYFINIGLMRKLVSSRPKIGDYTVDNFLEVRDINGDLKVQKLIGTQTTGTANRQTLVDGGLGIAIDKTLDINYELDLVVGDKVYLYGKFTLDGTGAGWKGVVGYIQTYSTSINVVAETTTDETTAKIILIHEAINQALAVVTDEDNRLYSEFFGREDLGYALDGCGAYKAILNGFSIRNATGFNNPKLSLQELIKSVDNIFCLGLGYETILGENKIRIEDRGYFYQDEEIMEITHIGNYTESVALELIFNKILVGYLKYLYQDLQFLDEFNAEHEYVTPIINNDSPLDLRAALITSGYAIETTRRKQFGDNPDESTQYDDDGFLIAVIEQPNTSSDQATFGNDATGYGYIEYPTGIPIEVSAGDEIEVSGTTSNNGTYHVLSVGSIRINLSAAVIPEIVFATVTNLSRPYTAEKDEAFDLVTGVLSPETSYNLRHTPKRNLMNHAKWINGGLYYKQAGDLVKNTFFKLNGDLTTQLKTSDPCPLGDINYDVLQEKADVYLAQFQDKDNYFIPEWVTFESRVSMSDIRTIKNCMTGADLFGRNYGYIKCRDQSGLNWVKSWIYDMTYNPNTESVKFVCLKKEVTPITPPDPFVCTDYADYTFADFEALPNLSSSIEQCIFANFN